MTDLLQIVEALVALGYGGTRAWRAALELIRARNRTGTGAGLLEYDYTAKTWVDFGPKKQPNKWVTLRALRVLKTVE